MQDDLDKLIDGALSVYSRAEPLAGLEDRVVNRVRLAEVSRRRRWHWALAVTVPVLAAILIVVFARKPQPAPVARVAPPPVRVETAPPSPPRAAIQHVVATAGAKNTAAEFTARAAQEGNVPHADAVDERGAIAGGIG